MSLSISQLPSLTLCLILFYGAFSRLTHGEHSPQFYAYQCERQPNDGSLAATAVPFVDLTLASLLLLPQQRLKSWAAIAFVVMQSIGICVQVQARKDWTGDVLMMALGLLVVIAA